MKKPADAEFEKAVRESNKKYDDYMNQGRHADFANLVTQDYVWVDEFKDITVRGKAAVVALAREWIELGVTNEKITLEECWSNGNVGVQISRIQFDIPDASKKLQRKHGRFCEVMEKEADGVWRTRSQFYFSKD
jgi:ketosteroid isomerase-like protein